MKKKTHGNSGPNQEVLKTTEEIVQMSLTLVIKIITRKTSDICGVVCMFAVTSKLSKEPKSVLLLGNKE